ncbi:GNAT family N-acetyltransferase [Brachybacterium tyrofermentans]|uniref:GNAT family N-acetyltransferase n=1 Tax=Brachybacterium tyrofermentans TaxID=47848 RepID=UPI003FD63E6C
MTGGSVQPCVQSHPVEVRVATAADLGTLQRAIYAAWTWREEWHERAYVAHAAQSLPDSYVDDFGKVAGDAGVIAAAADRGGEQVLGAAWYRFFSHESHRSGFVAEDVPELVISVEESARGRGVGRLLMEALTELASSRGITRLSLHVNRENTRARRMYSSFGFEETELGDRRGVVMVMRLAGE